jgi:hypothetical protein
LKRMLFTPLKIRLILNRIYWALLRGIYVFAKIKKQT